jgi:hypothetical protein
MMDSFFMFLLLFYLHHPPGDALLLNETYGIEDSKFTTSDGKYVDIRGIDPGGCLWKSLQVKIRKEKQQREREREQQMEIERQGRVKKFAIGLIAVSIVHLSSFLKTDILGIRSAVSGLLTISSRVFPIY